MKKTTYVMIGLAVGGLLTLLGVITYIFTCTGYEFEQEIHIDGEMISHDLPHFKRIRIEDLSGERYSLNEESGRLIVEQNDTVETGKLTFCEGWRDMLSARVEGDTLVLSIKIKTDSDMRTWPVVYASDPILLTVPREVMEIQNTTFRYVLRLSKFHDADLYVSSRSSVNTYDCNFRDYVNFAGYEWCESRNTQKVYLNLHRSKIDSFVSVDEFREFGVGMDSVSSVNMFTWLSVDAPGVDDINLIDCRVNSFTWVQNDSSRTLTLRADADIMARMK